MVTEHLATLVTVADAGSLSAASARLGLPLATVSRQIAAVEAALGVPLFERTGRGVRATAPGRLFVERSREALGLLDLARAEVGGAWTGEPDFLRLSAPPDPANLLLPGVLATLAERHPTLTLDLRAEVRRVSVVEEAYDAVVRLGALEESALIPRRLGQVQLLACVPPAGEGSRPLEWVRVQGVQAEGLSSGRLVVPSFQVAAELAARTGRGALLPSWSALPYLEAGRLALGTDRPRRGEVEVHLLRTPRHRRSARLAELGDLLEAELASLAARCAALAGPSLSVGVG